MPAKDEGVVYLRDEISPQSRRYTFKGTFVRKIGQLQVREVLKSFTTVVIELLLEGRLVEHWKHLLLVPMKIGRVPKVVCAHRVTHHTQHIGA